MTQLSMFDPVEIPLTKGQIAIVDPVDADLAAYKWCTECKNLNDHKYAKRRKPGPKHVYKYLYLHRVVLARKLGRELAPHEIADHANGNTLDNRRDNLRLATKAQNQQNQKLRSNNTSGYKGVHFNKQIGKWGALIHANRQKFPLGWFDTPEEASEAYRAAALKYHNEFARFK